MKNTNRQTSPIGRSTKEEKAGLSLLRPRLIEIIGDNYVYFNEILQNICTGIKTFISKTVSPFIARLKSKKFPAAENMFLSLSASGKSYVFAFSNPFKNQLQPDPYRLHTHCHYFVRLPR